MRRRDWFQLAAVALALAPTSASAKSPHMVMASSSSGVTTGGITYYGGPIMAGRVNVYVYWYGSFPSWSQTHSLVDYFISNWGASHSYGVLRSYTGSNGRVSPELVLAGEVVDSASSGTHLLDSDVRTIISNAINRPNAPFPSDQNGIYLFIIGQGVSVTAGTDTICGNICGYHWTQSVNGADIKYSVVGAANCGNCPSGGLPASPNQNMYADQTVNVIAHEIGEAVTDPDGNAWGTGQNEVGDKCNFNFSEQHRAPNGINATAKVGTKYYMIQKLWTPTNGGGCYSGYSPPAALIWQQGFGGAIGAWKMRDQTAITSFLSYSGIPTGQKVLAVGDFSNGIDPQLLTISTDNTGPLTMRTLHSDGTSSSATMFQSFDAVNLKIAGTGDFNGDGFSDLLVANTTTGDTQLFLMQGTTVLSMQDLGAFLPWLPQSTADFNGDGLADILWVDGVDTLQGVWTSSVPTGGGSVSFTIWSAVTGRSDVGYIGATDLNGDTRADIGYFPRKSDGVWFIDTLQFGSAPSVSVTHNQIMGGVFPSQFAGYVDANRDGTSDLYSQTPGGLRIFSMGDWKTGTFTGLNITDYTTAPTFGDAGWVVVGTGGFKE
jgi:hypothetical protein